MKNNCLERYLSKNKLKNIDSIYELEDNTTLKENINIPNCKLVYNKIDKILKLDFNLALYGYGSKITFIKNYKKYSKNKISFLKEIPNKNEIVIIPELNEKTYKLIKKIKTKYIILIDNINSHFIIKENWIINNFLYLLDITDYCQNYDLEINNLELLTNNENKMNMKEIELILSSLTLKTKQIYKLIILSTDKKPYNSNSLFQTCKNHCIVRRI